MRKGEREETYKYDKKLNRNGIVKKNTEGIKNMTFQKVQKLH